MSLEAQAWQQAKEVLAGKGYTWAGTVKGRDGWFKWPNMLWVRR